MTDSKESKDLNILYNVFGSPLFSISRRASIENDSLSTDFNGESLSNNFQKQQPFSFNQNSPLLTRRDRKIQNIRHHSPPVIKKFPSPFGSPINPIV